MNPLLTKKSTNAYKSATASYKTSDECLFINSCLTYSCVYMFENFHCCVFNYIGVSIMMKVNCSHTDVAVVHSFLPHGGSVVTNVAVLKRQLN